MKKYFLLSLLAVFGLFANAAEPQRVGNRDGEYHFDYDPGLGSATMTMTGYIMLNNVEVTGTDMELGIFTADGICRGREKLADWSGLLGHYLLFLNITGDVGLTLTEYRLYDHSTGEEIFVTSDVLFFVFRKSMAAVKQLTASS